MKREFKDMRAMIRALDAKLDEALQRQREDTVKQSASVKKHTSAADLKLKYVFHGDSLWNFAANISLFSSPQVVHHRRDGGGGQHAREGGGAGDVPGLPQIAHDEESPAQDRGQRVHARRPLHEALPHQAARVRI